MPYSIWIPLALIIVSVSAYTSFRSNQSKDLWPWFFLNWATWSLPVWALISRKSTDLVYDGLLYDVLMVFAYTIIMTGLTQSFRDPLTFRQVCGIITVLAGFILFKTG